MCSEPFPGSPEHYAGQSTAPAATRITKVALAPGDIGEDRLTSVMPAAGGSVGGGGGAVGGGGGWVGASVTVGGGGGWVGTSVAVGSGAGCVGTGVRGDRVGAGASTLITTVRFPPKNRSSP